MLVYFKALHTEDSLKDLILNSSVQAVIQIECLLNITFRALPQNQAWMGKTRNPEL
jgi:hypothetical protein